MSLYKPEYQISPYLLKLVAEASELKKWFEHTTIDVSLNMSWLPTIQKDTAERLARSSTAIEGNDLNLDEVKAIARGETITRKKESILEVQNYLRAVQWLWKKAKSINEDNLLELHKILTKDLLEKDKSGHYKQKPNRIIDGQGRIEYTPPPPEKVKELTQNLLEWINEEKNNLHPIILAAIAQHQLVSIHPFSDGNGRISRLLSIWILYTQNFDTHHLFALDEFFEKNRAQYYQKLQQARDLDYDLTHWIEYFAEGILETLKLTQKRILDLQVSANNKITLTEKQEHLLRFLRDRGKVKSTHIEKEFKITRARVNQIIKPLVESGLVIRVGQTRSTHYHLA